MRQINFWPVLGLFLTVFSAINSGQAQEIIRIDHGQLLNINGHTVEYQSCAGLSYMIPNRTSEEFDSFVNAGKAGRLPGIVIDGLGNADSQWYYEDKDDDGWGTEYRQCLGGPSGDYTATQSGDCDDVDAHAYPGGTELWCNGIDENCDGQDGIAGATDFAYRQRQCTLLSDYLAAPIKNPEEEYCGNRAVFAVVALKANGGPSEDRELHLQNAMDWVEWITDQDWTGNDWPDGSPPCYFQLDSFLRLVLDTEIFNQFTQSTQESLLDALWDFVNERSLYAYPASGDTWNINGSENHDIVKEASVFMAVQALAKSMNPVYPSSRLLHDGKSLNDHYSVWTSFYKLYFKERAMRGLLLEIASPTYSRYTLPYVYLIADFAYSSILKDQARKFLDLYWSDVAQDYIPEIGVRGGAQTRAYKDKILTYGDWEGCQPFYYLFNWFGNPEKDFPTMGAVTSAYQPPEVVSSIALANKPPYLFRLNVRGLVTVNAQTTITASDSRQTVPISPEPVGVAAEYVSEAWHRIQAFKNTLLCSHKTRWPGRCFQRTTMPGFLFVGLAAGSGGYLGGGKTAYRVTAVSNNAMIAQRDPNHVDNEGIRFYFSYDGTYGDV